MVRTAVFPVGGLGTRFLPATKSMPKEMLPVVDKPLIQYAVEEAKAAGIEQFIFVTGRGKAAIEDHFDYSYELSQELAKKEKTHFLDLSQDMVFAPGKLCYLRQQAPLGLGHAVWCARKVVGNQPFAVLLADDLIVGAAPCLKQMINAYTGGNMVAVQGVAAEDVSKYGILDVASTTGPLYAAQGVVEKPEVKKAPSQIAIMGRYILDPKIFDVLERQQSGRGGEIQLTDALQTLLPKTPLTGYAFEGRRFDCGDKAGWLEANISCALDNKELQGEMRVILERLYKERVTS